VQSSSTGDTYFKPKSGYVGETTWDRPTAPAAAEEEQPEQRDAPASLYSGSAAEHEVPPVPPEPTLSLSDIAPEALEAVVPPHDPPPVPAVNRARAELRAVVALMPKSSQGAAAAPAPAPAPAPKWACCGSRPQKGGRQPRKQPTQAATPRQPKQPAAAPEPAPAAVEEGVPPESAAAAASKLVVTKSNAGLQEGEQQRGAIKAEIDSLESQLDGAVSGATEAEAALSKAEEASKAAVDEARCGSPHSVHPRVCERLQVHLTPGVVFWRIWLCSGKGDVTETVDARLLEVSEQTKLVRTASAKVTSTAEEVRKSVRKLRDQLNGPSGDLATANAQLRKENEALKGLLEEQTGTPLDVRSILPFRIRGFPLGRSTARIATDEFCPH